MFSSGVDTKAAEQLLPDFSLSGQEVIAATVELSHAGRDQRSAQYNAPECRFTIRQRRNSIAYQAEPHPHVQMLDRFRFRHSYQSFVGSMNRFTFDQIV
jgi:hypothetical protein